MPSEVRPKDRRLTVARSGNGPARSLAGVLIFVLAAAALAGQALAEKRVALVIGNSAYRHAPALPNPKNDAEGMAASLKRLGFEVAAGTDLDEAAMRSLLQSFARKLEGADVALVFYAGHGLQVQGRNYLIPVDAKLEQESDLPFQAVSLDLVQGLMEQAQRTNIMILDACRDNPLARNLARSMGTRSVGIGRGLGEAKAGIGTLIVYATQPGNVALDGEGQHSPFTLALLKHIEAPGLEIRQVLTRVRNEVITATHDKQVPWDSSSLRGDFFFAAAPSPTPPGATPPPAATDGPAPRGPSADSEVVFWQSIKDSKNAADYKAYLAKYPQGTFADLAKIRIAEIEKSVVITPPAPTTPEKPARPAAPRRTSTYEVGMTVESMNGYFATETVATPQICQARCISNPECGTWYVSGLGTCQLFHGRQRLRRMSKDSKDWVAGIVRTTPAAAPAQPSTPPAVPQAPRRTSTFERGVYVNNDKSIVAELRSVASAQSCQAACLGNPKCGAWRYYEPTYADPILNRTCWLMTAEQSRWATTQPIISGVIRAMPSR